jgi:hypothetical protein
VSSTRRFACAIILFQAEKTTLLWFRLSRSTDVAAGVYSVYIETIDVKPGSLPIDPLPEISMCPPVLPSIILFCMGYGGPPWNGSSTKLSVDCSGSLYEVSPSIRSLAVTWLLRMLSDPKEGFS